MELAVGTIISGKVTAITKFGAFVSLPGGKSGLVHISEVAAAFVSDVHDYLTEGQEVTVKIPRRGKSICPSSRPNPSRNARSRPDRPGPRAVVPAPAAAGGLPVRHRPQWSCSPRRSRPSRTS